MKWRCCCSICHLLTYLSLPDVTTVIPYLKSQCSMVGIYRPCIDSMTQMWVRHGLSDAGFLSGIFLNTCRHLSRLTQDHQGPQFSNLATLYKLVCLRTVNDAINSHSDGLLFSDSIVAQVVILALDEVGLRRLSSCRPDGGLGANDGFSRR
jgi:hypothetical protein